MSQRGSGYKRIERDAYETPSWVTEALIPHLPKIGGLIWEPACGSGKMVRALSEAGLSVVGTDVTTGTDFLKSNPVKGCRAIITNPPYALAKEFIERALRVQGCDVVVMLLRTDYDHAKTRAHLFDQCDAFAKKVVLTRRIVWFDDAEKKAAPSFNHAWYIWNHKHEGPPTLAYGHE
jgi:methylase of polypeptide subunit release factors